MKTLKNILVIIPPLQVFSPAKKLVGHKTNKGKKDLFALPTKPVKYGIVKVPKGIKMRKGIAGKIWDDTYKWGNGEGIQYEVLEWDDLRDKSKDWFQEIKNF